MIKNVTPKQLALISSFAIALLVTLLALVGILIDLVDGAWYYALLLGVLSFSCTYLIIFYVLKLYIYRKIKLIYKNIRSSKRSAKESIVDMSENILDTVEKEVSDWTESRDKEIESLKSMERYRRDFMGDVSHELKTPIFSIQGYLHTLLDGALYDENINLDYLRKAARNVDRLQTIVDDLESISKLESGTLMLDIQAFDIKELCQEVFDELEILANNNKVNLLFKEGAANAFKVKGDRDSIRQVLSNLIGNSIKYGVENGNTKISFYDMDNVILVEIADNGIGISEDHLKHLFDRFYRVDKSRSRQQGGSGLGLAIVKHIVEAHQQTINVRSTLNEGSTFGFTLSKV